MSHQGAPNSLRGASGQLNSYSRRPLIVVHRDAAPGSKSWISTYIFFYARCIGKLETTSLNFYMSFLSVRRREMFC